MRRVRDHDHVDWSSLMEGSDPAHLRANYARLAHLRLSLNYNVKPHNGMARRGKQSQYSECDIVGARLKIYKADRQGVSFSVALWQ